MSNCYALVGCPPPVRETSGRFRFSPFVLRTGTRCGEFYPLSRINDKISCTKVIIMFRVSKILLGEESEEEQAGCLVVGM